MIKILNIRIWSPESGEGYITLTDGLFTITCSTYDYSQAISEEQIIKHDISLFIPKLINNTETNTCFVKHVGQDPSSYELQGIIESKEIFKYNFKCNRIIRGALRLFRKKLYKYIIKIGEFRLSYTSNKNHEIGEYIHLSTIEIRMEF